MKRRENSPLFWVLADLRAPWRRRRSVYVTEAELTAAVGSALAIAIAPVEPDQAPPQRTVSNYCRRLLAEDIRRFELRAAWMRDDALKAPDSETAARAIVVSEQLERLAADYHVLLELSAPIATPATVPPPGTNS